jgi:hypothetical protein
MTKRPHKALRAIGGSMTPSEVRSVDEYVQSLEAALKAVTFNAESWHAGEDGCRRALAVIAQWASDPSSVPEGVDATTLKAALDTDEAPASSPKGADG